jgi:two-component system nitrate/nitrite sensor histidine kinase NarX
VSVRQARIVAERGEAIEASRVREVLRAAGLAVPSVVVGATLAAALFLLTLQDARPHLEWAAPLAMAALVAASLAVMLFWSRLRSQLLLPLVRLEYSLSRVCQGEPGASDSLDDADGRTQALLGDLAQILSVD